MLDSRGPVLYRGERIGRNGDRFRIFKFRSMVADAEARKAGLAALNERELVFKIKNDPRLTGLGRWLRKFSIDEWPQLWNVLRGDMSLVGPRPAVPSEVESYQRWQRRRLPDSIPRQVGGRMVSRNSWICGYGSGIPRGCCRFDLGLCLRVQSHLYRMPSFRSGI